MSILNLESAEFAADPYGAYVDVRRQGEAVYDEQLRVWLVAGYKTNVALLNDARMIKDRRYETLSEAEQSSATLRMKALWILLRDGEFHRRVRSVVAPALHHRAVVEMTGLVEEVCRRLVDTIPPAGQPFDLVSTIAKPLPFEVISALLDVGEEDVQQLRAASAALFRSLEPGMSAQQWQEAESAAAYYTDFFGARLTNEDADHGPIMAAIRAALDSAALSLDEAIATCSLFFIAGHETTTHFIGNAVHSLIGHPDEIVRLPQRLAAGGLLDELWRHDTSVQHTMRVATQDVSIGSTIVPAGERCLFLLGAANRDPRVFSDPDRLNPDRPRRTHLGFGYGAHFCLGAGLARLEVATLLRLLASIATRWSLHECPLWTKSLTVRGPSRLIVRIH